MSLTFVSQVPLLYVALFFCNIRKIDNWWTFYESQCYYFHIWSVINSCILVFLYFSSDILSKTLTILYIQKYQSYFFAISITDYYILTWRLMHAKYETLTHTDVKVCPKKLITLNKSCPATLTNKMAFYLHIEALSLLFI